ncbi:MAG: hypothetical protein CVV64_05395 [Candidatus Wallbacteria bacterium HGW-Wallbacteria-1]|jgi:zinc transport system substrate-binding protein|uniref:ABC transporter substrate-binding protein n=1 Tax=Candidatus Wallbacteria bacterium HGW-Wallbacteria-1 TaxID=2013854 RepID=A0A2N1PS98_9BACT|nr:MAG: hypothetical protein CVV64_05395 [Candidatus Wallbacteria bacterium HGW-Wallbacteria-1]
MHEKRRDFLFLVLIVFCVCLFHSAESVASPLKAEKTVCVSIPPQAYLMEKIAGNKVNIVVLVEKGSSPATMEVTPSLMGRIGRAGVWFTTGVPFEKVLVSKVSSVFPSLTIVDCNKNIPLRSIDGDHDSGNDINVVHPAKGGHSHEGMDPHVWLNPCFAVLQARVMVSWLSQRDPQNSDYYSERFEKTEKSLKQLDNSIREILSPFRGMNLVVFHPSFGYFCDAYGLRQIAIEDQGHDPSSRFLAGLMRKMQLSGVSKIFIQPEFSDRAARTLAESIGAGVEVLDPLSGDYESAMVEMARKIASALGNQKPIGKSQCDADSANGCSSIDKDKDNDKDVNGMQKGHDHEQHSGH